MWNLSGKNKNKKLLPLKSREKNNSKALETLSSIDYEHCWSGKAFATKGNVYTSSQFKAKECIWARSFINYCIDEIANGTHTKNRACPYYGQQDK